MDLRKSFLYESFIVDTESSGKPETTNKKKKKNQLSTNQAIMTENKYINSTIISPNKKTTITFYSKNLMQ